MREFQACHCCGQIHRLPALDSSQVAVCIRCGARFTNPHEADRTAMQTAASALGAFILFWPAVLLPILKPGDRLRHRGIEVGEVGSVELDSGLEGVLLTIELIPAAEGIAREGDSDDWIIDPSVPLDASWHGGCLISVKDGRLIGIVLTTTSPAKVATIPKDLNVSR